MENKDSYLNNDSQEVTLRDKTNLNHSLEFNFSLQDQIYEPITNMENKTTYALISYSITSVNKKFQPLNLLYMLNIDSYKFEDITVSEDKPKSRDVRFMLNKCNFEENSIVLTLKASPFTTYSVMEHFKKKNLKHVLYSKKHYTPIIDYSKHYLHGMVSMMLFNKHLVTDLDVKNLTETWNTEGQPLIKKISIDYDVKPNLLYFK